MDAAVADEKTHYVAMEVLGSSHTSLSYPVSIGASTGDQRWIWHITPLGEWIEAAAGDAYRSTVNLDFLLAQGRDPFLVARELNAIFLGQNVVVATECEQRWIRLLFTETNVICAFPVCRLDECFSEEECHRIGTLRGPTCERREADIHATTLHRAISNL